MVLGTRGLFGASSRCTSTVAMGFVSCQTFQTLSGVGHRARAPPLKTRGLDFTLRSISYGSKGHFQRDSGLVQALRHATCESRRRRHFHVSRRTMNAERQEGHERHEQHEQHEQHERERQHQAQRVGAWLGAAAALMMGAYVFSSLKRDASLFYETREAIHEASLTQGSRESDARSGLVFADHYSDKALPNEPPIYRICLTGGPSSGKTSSMAYLRDKLSGLGFQVFVVTEIATLLLTGGATYRPDMDMDELLAFESALMKNQMVVEDSYIDIARASKRPTVILCDRGVLDAKAYMSQEVFESLLDAHGWNETKLRESRYDAVIHMVTAAIGAENFYTRDNNPARMETPQEAAALDHRLRESYIGHPNFTIIDNSTHFEGKVERVYAYVGSIVGLPKAISEKKKFLLRRDLSEEEFPPFLKHELHEMTQCFLKERDVNAETRIRKRSQKGTHTYSMTTKRISSDNKEETVTVRPISAKAYYELVDSVDQEMPPVKKIIRSFVYGEYYFELATYKLYENEAENPVVLQVEAPKGNIDLPYFLKSLIVKDVTPERETDDYYGSYHFSKLLAERRRTHL